MVQNGKYVAVNSPHSEGIISFSGSNKYLVAMYSFSTFFKDYRAALKRVSLAVKVFIILMQGTIGFIGFMVMALSFSMDLFECILYALILPGFLVWIPVLARHWERSESH